MGGTGQPDASGRGPVQSAAPVKLAPGRHLAVAMIPVGGATNGHPALFVFLGPPTPGPRRPPVAILSSSAPDPAGAPTISSQGSGATTSAPATTPSSSTDATAFPFTLPSAPGPGGTQAVATNTTDGGVTYDVAYALVTVGGGANVTNTNGAYALAHCHACTTVAVSFQVVLVVGQSHVIAPINAAGALNYDCPACTTTALADQLVVTLKSQPTQALVTTLENDLKQLNALPALGAGGTPTAVASQVATVQQEVQSALQSSGLEANPPTASGSTSTTATPASGSPTSSTATPTPSTSTSPSPTSPATTTTSSPPPTTTTGPTTSTTTTAPTSTTTSTATSTTPSGG
jgi:putative peptide zinc metalloprotease protein